MKGGFIAAFDAKTGARRWWTNRTETTGWGTPIAIRAGGRDEIIISSFRAIYAYNPDNTPPRKSFRRPWSDKAWSSPRSDAARPSQ